MTVGTPDGAKDSTVDPVLQSALADMATDGFNADDPIGTSSQDEPTAADASAQPDAAPDPGDDGTPDPDAPAAAVAASTASPDTSASPADDPLAGAEPFTFTVDGQARTMDGVFRIPGEGLIVPEDRVPQFQLIASRAESLEHANRELYRQHQDLERLTAWKTRGSDGTETTLTGREALEASRVVSARHAAALDTLAQVFKGSPTALLSSDADGNLSWNRAALEHLLTRSELAELNAERMTRSHFQSIATTPTTPATPDLSTAAPQIVASLATQLNATSLTDEDRTVLAKRLPRYIKDATPEDVKANPALKLGEPIVEAEFYDLITERATMRAKATATAKTTDAASKFNAGQKQGLKPAPTAKPSTPPAASIAATPAPGRQAAWDSLLHTALQELAS